MFIYYVILTFIFIASILPKGYSRLSYWPIFAFLFFFAALRSSSVDQDYLGYLEYYRDAISGTFINVEPSFLIISSLIDAAAADPRWLFVVYDFFGLLITAYAISRIVRDRLTVVMFYFSGHFLLWPMTQIRVGLAGAIFLVAIPYLAKSQRVLYFMTVTLATLVHYLGVILYFLAPLDSKAKSLWKVSLFIPIAVLIYLTGFSIVIFSKYIPIELISIKLLSYQDQISKYQNIFNYLLIARCLFLVILFIFKKELMRISIYFNLLLKVYLMAIFMHIAFGMSPLASRASELLLIVESILIAICSRLIPNVFLSRFVVFVISILYLSFNIFYVKLVKNYTMIPIL